MTRNRQQLSKAQAAYDNRLPPDDMPESDNEPSCAKCGTTEWSLWQRGGVEQDEIWECCNCGNRRVE